jgi:hypothetical protein
MYGNPQLLVTNCDLITRKGNELGTLHQISNFVHNNLMHISRHLPTNASGQMHFGIIFYIKELHN